MPMIASQIKAYPPVIVMPIIRAVQRPYTYLEKLRHGFGSAIDPAGFREFLSDVPDNIPYFRCFRDVIYFWGNWASEKRLTGRLKFTLDQRHESDYNAGVLYRYLANLPEWTGSSYLNQEIRFGSRRAVGIQAADLYAREVMERLDNRNWPS